MILAAFLCAQALAVDGDTLRCHRPDGTAYRVRLAAIDAPELPGHCRRGRRCASGDPFVSAAALNYLIVGDAVRCRRVDARPDRAGVQALDRWRRPVVRCSVRLANGEIDLSDEMLRLQLVRNWP